MPSYTAAGPLSSPDPSYAAEVIRRHRRQAAEHATRFGDGHRDRMMLRQCDRSPAGRPLPDAEPLAKAKEPGQGSGVSRRLTWAVFRVRVSVRPCPASRVVLPAGTCRQGSALTRACSSGWFCFTKRATDYDVSVASCRARWWSPR